jgi:hypothetical protein
MKINKWTLGLASLGLVSLVSEARAQTNALMTTVSATTISGYVDTSAVWNPGTGNANPAPYGLNAGKQDGFNLDAVDIRLQKALDEAQWSAGYVAELMFGPDSGAITADPAIRQAYVEFRAPVGNGLDFQMGRWDNLIGYESNDSYKNPNWTHSYGYSLEPTEHTGLLSTYKICDALTAQVGVVDTLTTVGINARSTGGAVFANGEPEGEKGLVSLLSFTAPTNWGFVSGSSAYFGFDWGQGPGGGSPRRDHFYVGSTLNTPLKDLTVGGAFDYVTHEDFAGFDTGHAFAFGGYLSYKLTDKLTLNGRAEYAEGRYFADVGAGVVPGAAGLPLPTSEEEVFALTATVQYQLWDNVVSRLELRWDDAVDGGYSASPFGGTTAGIGAKKNEVLLAANVIYKF